MLVFITVNVVLDIYLDSKTADYDLFHCSFLVSHLCRFDWQMMIKSDVLGRTLEVMVKNSVGPFSKQRVNMGVLHLRLSEIDDLGKAMTEWWGTYHLSTCSVFLSVVRQKEV